MPDQCYVCLRDISELCGDARQLLCCGAVICLQDFKALTKKECGICHKPITVMSIVNGLVNRLTSTEDLVAKQELSLSSENELQKLIKETADFSEILKRIKSLEMLRDL